MIKNLALVKHELKENKCYLYEIPESWALCTGDVILVMYSPLKMEREATLVADSFMVYGEKELEKVCAMHKTAPCQLRRALGYVRKEVEYFDHLDWDEEPAEEINRPCPASEEEEEIQLSDEEKKKLEGLAKDFVDVIERTCGELGMEGYHAEITFHKGDEDDGEY